jgi:hypothetical protein
LLPEVAHAHEHDEPVDLSVPVTDMLTARHLLIELHRLTGRQGQLKATLASIQGEYRARIAELEQREAHVRQSLLNYCNQNGPLSLPDVGSCSVRRNKPKPVIEDEQAFARWADTEGFTHVQIDRDAAMRYAASLLASEGTLAPGVGMSPASESLTVRGVK